MSAVGSARVIGEEDNTVTPPGVLADEPQPITPVEFLALRNLLLDCGSLHSLCLETYSKHADREDCMSSEARLAQALADIFVSCDIEPLEADDISELWSGNLNFAEFYMTSHELLKSLYQTLTIEGEFMGVVPQDNGPA